MQHEERTATTTDIDAAARRVLDGRCLVLVGLMGAGKSVIGRMTASRLDLPFVDSDHEIERVSRMSIGDLFELYGEDEFRALEARVIARLIETGPRILSTGGGAFIAERTRALVKERALSLWLDADIETLWGRVKRRDTRPLLRTADPKATLQALMDERYPVYAEADLAVQSRDVGKHVVVDEVLETLARHGDGR
ncbi:shikimate kinase [Pararhizobium mangrovi]|uniref:Shikimate kinase n=1 Tax=Pararhizobium mangrovi TaxID=2590452 RepID=A0A506U225_9HYPH|nr:shikimate kinase [Pararhizobium mangrovi]